MNDNSSTVHSGLRHLLGRVDLGAEVAGELAFPGGAGDFLEAVDHVAQLTDANSRELLVLALLAISAVLVFGSVKRFRKVAL